jgi:hypothetical protein
VALAVDDVVGECQKDGVGDGDPRLLMRLADRAVLGRLTETEVAAGERPLARSPVTPLDHQYPLRADDDDPDADADSIWHVWFSVITIAHLRSPAIAQRRARATAGSPGDPGRSRPQTR